MHVPRSIRSFLLPLDLTSEALDADGHTLLHHGDQAASAQVYERDCYGQIEEFSVCRPVGFGLDNVHDNYLDYLYLSSSSIKLNPPVHYQRAIPLFVSSSTDKQS